MLLYKKKIDSKFRIFIFKETKTKMSVKQRRKENLSYLQNEYYYSELVKSMFYQLTISNNEIYYIDLLGIDVYKDNQLFGTREIVNKKNNEIWNIYDTYHNKRLTYYPETGKYQSYRDVFQEFKEITKNEVNQILENQTMDIKEKRKLKRKTKKQQRLKEKKRELLLQKMRINQVLRDIDYLPDLPFDLDLS